MMRGHRQEIRLLVLFTVAALMVAACMSNGDLATTSTSASSSDTLVTTPTASTGDVEETTPEVPLEGFTYKVGMTVDITSTSPWAPDGTMFDFYVFGPTRASLFEIRYPGLAVAPLVAAGLPAEPVGEGDVWTITQPMRDDFTWSDGSLLTAHDVVFTFETVRDADLALWSYCWPYTETSSPRLLDVEVVDDFTVKLTFDERPGAAVWPHRTGLCWIEPRTPWEPVVAKALQSEDPAAVLGAAERLEVGDLSAGPLVFHGREEGAFIEEVKNENYANAGTVHTFWDDDSYAQNGVLYYGEGSGEPSVEYTEGPYLDRVLFSLYGDQTTAMLALIEGEIDFWLNPLGVSSPGLKEQGLEADNLRVAINPGNGLRYLAFNMRKSPGSYKEFRQALAYMIDKEFFTQNVLQGVAFPLYVLIPEGNEAWYDEERAQKIAGRYVGLSPQERLNSAVELLKSAGFTWEVEPSFDESSGEIVPGKGIIDPAGIPVPELEILAPPASYDPLRATASLWIEGWLEQLGVPAKANPTAFNTIVSRAWPGVGEEITFDMYILGWSLGDPNWPSYHESFFHSRHFAELDNGNNSPGYSNPEFDELADAMSFVTSQNEAYDMVWQMEEMLAEDLPYIVLFDTPIIEFYNETLHYPFTSTLSGIQYLAGMPAVVAKY